MKMTQSPFSLFTLAIFFVILSATSISTFGQAATDGTTPLALKPGSPAGSYSLSGFESVNPYNGNLNFSLPLISLTGRGGATFSVPLRINQKWIVQKELYTDPPPAVMYYYPSPSWWSADTGLQGIFDVGRLEVRQAGSKATSLRCGGSGYVHVQTLTRLTFTAPDGTEYELRDEDTGGQPDGADCSSNGFDRGTIFVTADGTSATFISDSNIYDYRYDNPANIPPSGYLLLRDGSRYRIVDGEVSWMTDRNGNKFSFTHNSNKQLTSIKDSLNRLVTITYGAGGGAYTEISYKGFEGDSRSIKVYTTSLSSALRSGFTSQTHAQLFPELNGAGMYENPISVVSSVELPNGKVYEFKYNSYGELARVKLPTGGAIEYDYAKGLTDGATSGVFTASSDKYVYRRVTERREYPDGGSSTGFYLKTTYSRPETSGSNAGYVEVEEYNVSNTRLSHIKHYFHGNPRDSFSIDPAAYPGWKEGKEYLTRIYQSNASTLMREITNDYEQRAAVSWWSGSADAEPPNDARLKETITTLVDTNQVSKQRFGYDDSVPFNNQNSVKEYDYGSGSPGTLLRETRTTFITSSTYTGNSVHIRNLPSQVSIYDGSETLKARTSFEYDNYTKEENDCEDSFHCALLARSNVSGFDSSNFGTSYTTRGNLTATTRHFVVSGSVSGSISSYIQYDVLGNSIRSIDARSSLANIIATNYDFADRFGTADGNAQNNSTPTELTGSPSLSSFAFPSQITNALGHVLYTQRDYYLGKAVDGEDPNGIVSSGYYDDELERPTQIRRAVKVGGVSSVLENQTTFDYDDTNRIITTTTDRDSNNDNVLVSKVYYDKFGRTTETKQYEGGSNYIAVQTDYDPQGRAYKTSNPFRPTSESAIWTIREYDYLGRVTEVATPDGAAVTTSYSGNSVTVSDQMNKQRKSVTDALGRLRQIYEAPNDTTNFNFLTSYEYDTLDNLTSVTQGTQPRTFNYDSLKRLISSSNPESGTICYGDVVSSVCQGNGYDANGNLTKKTDARGVVSTLVYDALNRNTSISYSNDPSGTLPVTRVYDTATLGIGKLYQSETTGTNGSRSTTDAYDALGRPTNVRQQFYVSSSWSTSYTTSRTYNLAGAVTAQTYPSGRTVSYAYDAAGRTTDFTGYLGDGANRNYSTEVLYSPFGGIVKEKFGTTIPIYNKLFYNSRGQLAEIREGTTYTGPTDGGWNRGAIINFYSGSCWGSCGGNNSTTAMTDNNGNLRSQAIYIPDDDAISTYTMRLQQYDYDELNRISWANETPDGGSEQWKQVYTYDQYGNRTINAASSFGGINENTFDTDDLDDTNRLYAPGDLLLSDSSRRMRYDQSGNLIKDTYTGYGLMTYNADNRLVTAQDYYSSTSYYTYNADGKRVRRKINNVETWAIYGMDGEIVSEYAASGSTNSPQKEYGYRNGQLLITAEGPASVARQNVALSSNGGTATASSSYSGYPASNANNGNRTSGEWNDNTGSSFPDWLQIDFSGSKTIEEIDVFTVQDNYYSPSTPTESLTFSLYGITNFDVQYWNGSSWSNVTGGTITGNNKVWRKVIFAPITTSKIRVSVNASVDGWTRITEVEAWTSNTINWLVTDQLGTPRMVFDESGNFSTVRRHDYLPYGEELGTGMSGRTSAQGYGGGDGLRQQFTSKERDVETGLDYFGARYYSNLQARFISVDPIFVTLERLVDPQRLNLYNYTKNNPLRFVDPNGEDIVIDSNNEQDARKKYEQFQKGLDPKDRSHSRFFVGDGKNGYAKGKFYIQIDSDYKSESKNFQALQAAANDRKVTTVAHFVKSGETFPALAGVQQGSKVVLKDAATVFPVPMRLGGEDGQGYTLYPKVDKPLAGVMYSTDKNVNVYILSEQSDVEIVVTLFHELRGHVFLSNMGREPMKAREDDPSVKAEIKASEREARTNFAKP